MPRDMSWGGGVRKVYLAELRALPKGRFSLLGAAILLLGPVLFAATVWVGVGGVHDAAMFDFVLLPTALLPMAAWRVSHARSSRFLQAVFTTPVTQAQYLLAQYLVVLTVGALYVATTLPYFAVHAAHIDLPEGAWLWPVVGLALAAAYAALGALLGVLFTSRGSLAAVVVAFAVAIWANLAWALLSSFVRMQPGLLRSLGLHAISTSPAMLLMGAFGLAPGVASEAPWRAGLAFVLLLLLALGGALWTFARAQAVETWEARGARAGVVALLLVALVASPLVIASAEYEKGGIQRGFSWSGGGAGVTAVLAPRGAPLTVLQQPFWEHESLPAGRAFEADLILGIFLPPDANGTLERAEVDLRGERVRVEGTPAVLGADDVVTAQVGRDGPQGAVLRVPLTVTLLDPGNLTMERYTVNATVSYRLAGNDTVVHAYNNMLVDGEVPGVRWQMALAGAPAPLALLAGAVVRRARTR